MAGKCEFLCVILTYGNIESFFSIFHLNYYFSTSEFSLHLNFVLLDFCVYEFWILFLFWFGLVLLFIIVVVGISCVLQSIGKYLMPCGICVFIYIFMYIVYISLCVLWFVWIWVLPFWFSAITLQNGHVKCLYSNISEIATNTK